MSQRNNNPLISVIIPIYNVEKYAEKCIDSVLHQTYEKLEVILVDDGSTDGSGAICDAYEKKDSRVRVIHQENGGLSAARNAGIEAATGEYIGLIDGDDFIEPDMYEVLYHHINRVGADMSICGVYELYPDGEPEKKPLWERVLSPKDAIRLAFIGEKFSVNAVNKLYKKELFDEIRYPVGKTTEDAFVIVDLFSKCHRIAVTTAQKYYYVHRSGSITTVKSPVNGLFTVEAYRENYRKVTEWYPDLEKVARMRLCWANFMAYDAILSSDSHEYDRMRRECRRYLKKNTVFICFRREFRMTRKISSLVLLFSERLYKKMVSVKGKKDDQNRYD